MTRIAIVIGSTRIGRKGADVARWVLERTLTRRDAEYHVVDLAPFGLPLLGDAAGQQVPSNDPVRAWVETVRGFDGYVLVSPEYNHAPNAALKNALDLGGAEWDNKAVAFVGYGGFGGVRAVEILRLVASSLGLAGIKAQVALTLSSDFTAEGAFIPRPHQDVAVDAMLEQLVVWAGAMRTIRTGAERAAA
jgi:NAD(P)H-dependent FMN reductase